MKSEMVDNILICRAVRFYARKDEDAFFDWIKKIDCIESTSALGRELYLHICADDIHDYDLRDLIGLFYRYKIDMKQLRRFLTKENKSWFFDNKKAFWHKRVFGDSKSKSSKIVHAVASSSGGQAH